jgi:hypothetical protein
VAGDTASRHVGVICLTRSGLAGIAVGTDNYPVPPAPALPPKAYGTTAKNKNTAKMIR